MSPNIIGSPFKKSGDKTFKAVYHLRSSVNCVVTIFAPDMETAKKIFKRHVDKPFISFNQVD